MSSPDRPALSRRDALKWLAGTAAAVPALPALAAKNQTEPAPPSSSKRSPIHDPDFTKPAVYPWDKLLSPEELKSATALADLILPKDENGPAASEVGVPEFIDEWISAPYPDKLEDRETIRGGIAWLNTESFSRFEKRFDELAMAEQTQIVDDVCDHTKVKPGFDLGTRFFRRFRGLCLSGYYTHSATWKHLGYVGNISIGGDYPGVPQEIIDLLKLQDVI